MTLCTPVAIIGNQVFALYPTGLRKDEYDWMEPKRQFGKEPLSCDLASMARLHAKASGR